MRFSLTNTWAKKLLRKVILVSATTVKTNDHHCKMTFCITSYFLGAKRDRGARHPAEGVQREQGGGLHRALPSPGWHPRRDGISFCHPSVWIYRWIGRAELAVGRWGYIVGLVKLYRVKPLVARFIREGFEEPEHNIQLHLWPGILGK